MQLSAASNAPSCQQVAKNVLTYTLGGAWSHFEHALDTTHGTHSNLLHTQSHAQDPLDFDPGHINLRRALAAGHAHVLTASVAARRLSAT